MSRLIKFRGWHVQKQKMFSPEEMGRDQLTISPDGRGFVNVSGSDTSLSVFVAAMIPLQFTGLHDKNGKEIYEGDVLEWNDGYAQNTTKEVVEFDSKKGSFVSVRKSYAGISRSIIEPRDSGGATTYQFKVIGNIHQNQELLQ